MNKGTVRGLPLVLLLVVFACNAAAAEDIMGRVVGVADGDTITVLVDGKKQVKVRLAQIDAPEKSQAYGKRAKQSLSDLLFGKQVKVVQTDTDRYGRIVGTVFTGELDVNAEQVRRGMAWVYRKYAKDESLFALEEGARTARRGLWDDPKAVPPWEFRHGEKNRSDLNEKSGEIEGMRCGNKRFCSQMTSCEEARFYLNECGMKKLDGDGDGVPCETLCR